MTPGAGPKGLVRAGDGDYLGRRTPSSGPAEPDARMSLNRKLVAWLLITGTLIIVVLGVGDYIQSTLALRFSLETRASSLAVQAATNVERRYEQAQGELAVIGHAVAIGAALPPLAGHYRDVRVLDGAVPRFEAAVLGVEPLDAGGCVAGDVRVSVAFADAAGRPYRAEARIPSSHFFAGVPSAGILGRDGLTAVLQDDGARLFDAGCTADSAADEAALRLVLEWSAGAAASDLVTGLLLKTEKVDDRIVAGARAPRSGLVVAVGVDFAEFAAPFIALRRQYLGIITLALALVFLFLFVSVRRDMRRLTAIAAAADDIGRGRFDVWLPPPTGDEIGRVSLALGRMTDRLSTTLRQVEVSRAMAAVGELATYLSHEVRNPLSSIRLNLQMLRRDLATGSVPDDGTQLVGLCLSELQRLEDVVKTVLEVGRTNSSAKGSCDAGDVVRDTLRVMQRKFTERDITVKPRLGAGDMQVGMASAALRSIILNLLLNAVDAVAGREGARIAVELQRVEEAGSAPWVELRVSDNGTGVPPEVLDRIFDPFFTTKPNGNGIGLPTALRAVQQCGGMIRCEEARWTTGAEFVVELPLADAAAATVDAAADEGALVPAGSA
jgi:signal transduction histidine kinase